jgi:hypothetical protein
MDRLNVDSVLILLNPSAQQVRSVLVANLRGNSEGNNNLTVKLEQSMRNGDFDRILEGRSVRYDNHLRSRRCSVLAARLAS